MSNLERFSFHGVRQSESAQLLDFQVRKRCMRTVAPTVFNYLAPLELYRTEKPYLSRLPFLPGFARTNIVGRSRPAQIHEVSRNEALFTLDESGFEFAKCSISSDGWTDATICATYIPNLMH